MEWELTDEELNKIVKGFAYTASKAEPQWWRREYMKIANAAVAKYQKWLKGQQEER